MFPSTAVIEIWRTPYLYSITSDFTDFTTGAVGLVGFAEVGFDDGTGVAVDAFGLPGLGSGSEGEELDAVGVLSNGDSLGFATITRSAIARKSPTLHEIANALTATKVVRNKEDFLTRRTPLYVFDDLEC